MTSCFAVAIADQLVQPSFILLGGGGVQLTNAGWSFFDKIGVDLHLASIAGSAPVLAITYRPQPQLG
jgi:hypothetical protein